MSVNRVEGETGVDPTEQAPCTRREYAFDKNGNRISAKTKAHAGGDCFYFGGQSTINYTYDALDRPVNAGDGNTALTLANPHGDNVTTISIPANQPGTVAATSISGWVDYTEYGTSKTGHSTGVGYGWLGKHERYTAPETAGLTLMGVRLDNPVRGAFTTTDPVAGGNTTAYAYPQDPVGSMDLDERMWSRKTWKKELNSAAGITSGLSAGLGVVPSFICSACAAGSAALGAASAGTYVAAGNKAAGKRTLISTGTNLVLGGAKIRNVARPLARGKNGGVKVSTVRAVKFQAQTFLRTNGRSGLVVRGAAAQGRSRTDTNYVRGTNYLLRQRVLVCSHCM